MKEMKKIFVSLMAVAALFVLASCEKNFDPKIYGTLSTTNFPATTADFERRYAPGIAKHPSDPSYRAVIQSLDRVVV